MAVDSNSLDSDRKLRTAVSRPSGDKCCGLIGECTTRCLCSTCRSSTLPTAGIASSIRSRLTKTEQGKGGVDANLGAKAALLLVSVRAGLASRRGRFIFARGNARIRWNVISGRVGRDLRPKPQEPDVRHKPQLPKRISPVPLFLKTWPTVVRF